MAKNASPMRLEKALVQAAALAGESCKRSTAGQIEYWAEIGRAVERILDPEAIIAVQSGLARVILEPTAAEPIASEVVFDRLEADRNHDALASRVNAMPISQPRYQASHVRPGLLEQVATDGSITLGHFAEGRFIPVN